MGQSIRVPGGTLKNVTVYNGTPNNYVVNINVATSLPDVYKSLSRDNFGIFSCRVYADAPISSSATRGPEIGSYSAETGILSISTGGTSLPMKSLVVKAWYI